MLTYISIGPVALPTYPLLSLVGLWLGMWLAARVAERAGIDGDHLYNIGLYGLAAGLLGGRLWYVITHWEAYAGVPLQALSLTANAIDPLAAALTALLAAFIYNQRQRLSLPHVADALALGAALTLTVGGVGAFLGSQKLGAPTDVPWGVELFGQVRHPAHLYQSLAGVVILGLGWWQYRRRPRWPGFSALLIILLYAGSRLLLDPFFASPQILGPGLRLVQVVALGAMVVILYTIMRLDQRHQS